MCGWGLPSGHSLNVERKPRTTTVASEKFERPEGEGGWPWAEPK